MNEALLFALAGFGIIVLLLCGMFALSIIVPLLFKGAQAILAALRADMRWFKARHTKLDMSVFERTVVEDDYDERYYNVD